MLKRLAKTLAYITASFTGFYIFTASAGFHRKDRWEHLRGCDFAHRGLHNLKAGIPENSMAAFKNAVDKGYGIELDVHLTADNQLVVFHDDTLLRMCGVNKKLNALTYYQLQDLSLAGTEQKIPLFSDVLSLVDGKVPLLIELKVDNSNQKLLSSLVWQQLSTYHGNYCIESFHPFVLRWFRFHHPEVVRGQLSCDFFKENPHCDIVLFLMANLMTNFLTRPDFISYKYLDMNNLAFLLNKKVFKVMTFAWTIKKRPAYDRYKNKVDGIIFEGFEP